MPTSTIDRPISGTAQQHEARPHEQAFSRLPNSASKQQTLVRRIATLSQFERDEQIRMARCVRALFIALFPQEFCRDVFEKHQPVTWYTLLEEDTASHLRWFAVVCIIAPNTVIYIGIFLFRLAGSLEDQISDRLDCTVRRKGIFTCVDAHDAL